MYIYIYMDDGVLLGLYRDNENGNDCSILGAPLQGVYSDSIAVI